MLFLGTTTGHAIRPAARRPAAADLVTTAAVAQLRGLTVAFRRPPLMDPYCSRGAGGLSTLLLLLPGLIAHRRGDARRARWYGVQTAMAFIADYAMIGRLSVFHGLDRLCATYTVASLTLRACRGSRTRPLRSGPRQGAPAMEAPPPRPRLARVHCIVSGVPALWCKARGAKAAQRGAARCQPSSIAPGHGPRRDGVPPPPPPTPTNTNRAPNVIRTQAMLWRGTCGRRCGTWLARRQPCSSRHARELSTCVRARVRVCCVLSLVVMYRTIPSLRNSEIENRSLFHLFP